MQCRTFFRYHSIPISFPPKIHSEAEVRDFVLGVYAQRLTVFRDLTVKVALMS
jgi:hypothetical protein